MPTGVYKRKEEYKKAISEKMKGHKHSEETKKKIGEANKISLLGRKLSEETKQKIREKGKLRTGKKGSNWKGGKVTCFCKICKKKFLVFPTYIRRGGGIFCSYSCAGIWKVKHSKKENTSIELAIEQELIKRHIPYLKQAPIEGIALVDFLLPNKIIIQCNGDYWYSKEKNKGKDIAQDTVLYFKGYKVFRFLGKDIKKSANKCVDSVLEKVEGINNNAQIQIFRK